MLTLRTILGQLCKAMRCSPQACSICLIWALPECFFQCICQPLSLQMCSKRLTVLAGNQCKRNSQGPYEVLEAQLPGSQLTLLTGPPSAVQRARGCLPVCACVLFSQCLSWHS